MPRRLIIIDNYDSFTYNLVQYLAELGAACDVRLNDATSPEAVLAAMPHGVVISPGPGTPDGAGATLAVIGACVGKVPVLGVCLGHQAIAKHFGAIVEKSKRPTHGKASPIEHEGRGLFRGIPSPVNMARYHSLAIAESSLPGCLEVTARTTEGEVMAIRHSARAVDGVQFHPESALSEHGKTLLGNWLDSLGSVAHAREPGARP